jgi:hypothetical protein
MLSEVARFCYLSQTVESESYFEIGLISKKTEASKPEVADPTCKYCYCQVAFTVGAVKPTFSGVSAALYLPGNT